MRKDVEQGENAAPLYVLDRSTAPWGDYGDILTHGMTVYRNNDEHPLELSRTGPFVPPISFPWPRLVVSRDFRRLMETSNLTGMTFGAVIKKKIVYLPWETWDLEAPSPRRYPAEGEPENYIIGRKHRSDIAEQMSELFELRLGQHADAVRSRNETSGALTTSVLIKTWDGTDLFRARESGYMYASERARRWFEKNAREWVEFTEAPVQ